MLSQAPNSTHRDHPLNAEALERPNICPNGDFSGTDAMSSPMTRQKGHRYPCYFTNHNRIARIPKGSLDFDLFNVSHTSHMIKTTAADHANLCLWHAKASFKSALNRQPFSHFERRQCLTSI